jgi:hypothetical protein
MMEGSGKYYTVSRSWVYKWYTRFSEEICDIYYAERSGRHPLSKDSAKFPIHDTTTAVLC